MIADALREIGAARSGVIDEDGNILAGNGTFEALSEAGIEKVKVVEADGNEWVVVRRKGLTKKEKAKLALYDNRTAELAEWDIENLGLLDDEHEDIFENIFGEDELAEMFGDKSGAGELEGEDETPEPPEEPKTKLGDMYQLGDHFLLCGDSTVRISVDRLMNGQKADLVFTDPPYGIRAVEHSGVLKNKYRPIQNDDSVDVAIKVFRSMDVDIPMVWWGANYYANALPNRSCWFVWDKNNGGSDQMDCELAWTNLNGVTRQFTQASEKTNRVHPTQKPVSLVEWCMERAAYRIEGPIIYDPFGGSGSTMIACEKMKRRCYMMEIDPAYCDVIVERYGNLFPEKEICQLSGEKKDAIGDGSTIGQIG